MLTQTLTATLRILFFRAGPQDFPFSTERGLTLGCIAFAMMANTLTAVIVAPALVALPMSAVFVAAVALTTRITLATRGVANRFQQTFNALLTTTGTLTLAMLPALIILAPTMVDFLKQLEANPDIANHPEHWPQFPIWAELMTYVLVPWQFAVTSYIFRHAANVGIFGSVMLAFALIFALLILQSLAGPLVAPLAG